MAIQYVQKPGSTKKITLASLGYKTLQDAANAGYSPVSAPKPATPVAPIQPKAPVVPDTPAYTPPKTLVTPVAPAAKEFYRIGVDIFEAGTQRKLGYNEWKRDWTGKSTEISAPQKSAAATLAKQTFYRVGNDIFEAETQRRIGSTEWGKKWSGRATEVKAPAVGIPDKITSEMLTEKAEAPAIDEAKINQDYVDKVNTTIEKYGLNAGANKTFVVGAARAAGVEPDLTLIGKTLGKVIEVYGLGDKVEGFGVQEPFVMPEGMEKIAHPDLAENYENISEDPTGTFLYGTPTSEGAAVTDREAAVTDGETLVSKTAGQDVDDLYNELIASKVDSMLEGVDMDEAMRKKQEASTAVEVSRQAIADKQLIDAVEMEGLGDQPVSMALISRDRTKYTQDEYVTNLKMTMDYNNNLILARMAEGNFLEAQRISKDIANDVFEIRKLQLDQLIYQDKIKADEYDRMQREIDWERKLALEYGYTYIPNIEAYNAIVKEYNINAGNFNEYIYKEGDRMYLKSTAEPKGDWEIVRDEDGKPISKMNAIDGTIVPLAEGEDIDFIMRTDRHNNPTAFTTDVAESFGLVEGVDYTKGDAFPDNPNLFTANLIGDGMAVTIKGIDHGGFYTASGQQRWTHTAMSNEEWHALDYAGKTNIIKQMYAKEGGSGVLFKEPVSRYQGVLDLVANGDLSKKEALAQIKDEDEKLELAKQLSAVKLAGVDQDAATQDKIDLADSLKDHKGLDSSVGPTKLTRLAFGDLFGAKADFIAGVEQLLSSLSLQALIDAKARGATFGALSDTEMDILKSAATKIGTWQKKDGNGKIVGYVIDEKRFKKELDHIKKTLDRSIKRQKEESANLINNNDPAGIL